MDKDTELFKGKSFSDILADIYTNSKKKDINDATVVVPLIKEYMEVAVRNDEQIVKLAAIIQRMLKDANSNDTDGGFGLTEDEKRQLLENAKEIDDKIDSLKNDGDDE